MTTHLSPLEIADAFSQIFMVLLGVRTTVSLVLMAATKARKALQ